VVVVLGALGWFDESWLDQGREMATGCGVLRLGSRMR